MFSDTHFHFRLMTEGRNLNGVEILEKMAQNNCFFGLDIGTKAGDLLEREQCVENTISAIKDSNQADKARNFMYFSAGIWPDVDSIKNRNQEIKTLKNNIETAANDPEQDTLHRKVIALGEFGLDHHWNPEGADGRSESDFDEQVFRGERELFEMQLQMAKEMKLPAIIHSRDAFDDTIDCLKNIGYHNGIIHCYSYGLEEAKKFLDLGWYLAFGGAITYNKKAKLEAIKELLAYVPSDRFLCETDSPYLAPVPLRGTQNSPVNIEYVYDFAAQARGCTKEELSVLVDGNIKKLFFGA